jgi:hypothetical protein
MDAADDARFFALLFDRIDLPIVLWVVGVLSGDLVQVFEGTILDNLSLPAGFDVPCGIFRVHNQQGDPGVGHHVPAFLALAGCIDTSAFSIKVTPYQDGLWPAIWHHGCEDAMNRLRE